MIGTLGGCGSGCGFTAGVVEDVLLVPINISYDRIVEQSLVKDELMVGHCSACMRVCVCVCVCVFVGRGEETGDTQGGN